MTAPKEDRWTIERPGRLLLARWMRLPDLAAAEAYRGAIFAAMQQDPSSVIVCADWRTGSVLSPEASEVLLGMLTGRSTQITRSAILLSPGKAIFDMQVERLVRQAGHPQRRTFRDVDEQLAYLSEVLTNAELERASSFLVKR
jgi:hypothetical protein